MSASGTLRGSAGLTLLTPLRTEAVYARRGAPGAKVVRTGMGPAASRASAARLAALPEISDGLSALVGVGGGLRAGQVAGDVVVASHLAAAKDGIAVPPMATLGLADSVAGTLESEGFRVSVGLVVSTPNIVRGGAERQTLADSGALAADMESWWLANGLFGPLDEGTPIPLIVVRVLLDCPGAGIASPVTLRGLPGAYRVLARVAGALETIASNAEPQAAARQSH